MSQCAEFKSRAYKLQLQGGFTLFILEDYCIILYLLPHIVQEHSSLDWLRDQQAHNS